MPYLSELQRRFFNANRARLEAQGVDVDHWNAVSKGKKLPKKVEPTLSEKNSASPAIIAAGLCILAEDTGRVLMLQRSFKETDAAAGKFEFPGGHLEEGESPLEGARREFEEEVGHRLPSSVAVRSDYVEGIYQLFVATVPNESEIKINRPLDRRVRNPDGDEIETVAWWIPKDMENNKSIRAELARVVSSKLKWAIRLAKLRARRMEKSAAISDLLSNPQSAAILGALAGGTGGAAAQLLKKKEDRNYLTGAATGAGLGGLAGYGASAAKNLLSPPVPGAAPTVDSSTPATPAAPVTDSSDLAAGIGAGAIGGAGLGSLATSGPSPLDKRIDAKLERARFGREMASSKADLLRRVSDGVAQSGNEALNSQHADIIKRVMAGEKLSPAELVGNPSKINQEMAAASSQSMAADAAKERAYGRVRRLLEARYGGDNRLGKIRSQNTNSRTLLGTLAGLIGGGGASAIANSLAGGKASASESSGVKEAGLDQKVINLARLLQFEILYAKQAGLKETVSQLISDGGQFLSEKLQDPSSRPLVTGAAGALGGAGSMLAAEALSKAPRKKQYLTAALTGGVAGGAAGIGGGLLYNHLSPGGGPPVDLRPEMERLKGDPAAFAKAMELKASQEAKNSLSAQVRGTADVGGVGVEAAGALTGAALGDNKRLQSFSPFKPFAGLDKEYLAADDKLNAARVENAKKLSLATSLEPRLRSIAKAIKDKATPVHTAAEATKADIQAKWDAAKAELKKMIDSKASLHASEGKTFGEVENLFANAQKAENADMVLGNEPKPLLDYVKSQTESKVNSKQMQALAEERARYADHKSFLEAMRAKQHGELAGLSDKQRALDIKFQKMLDGVKIPDSNALIEQLMAAELSGDPSAKAKLDVLKERMGHGSLADMLTKADADFKAKSHDITSAKLDRYNKLVSGDIEPIIEHDPLSPSKLKRGLTWFGSSPQRRTMAHRGVGAAAGGLAGFIGDMLWRKANGE